MDLPSVEKITEISQSITRLSNLVDLTKSQYPYLPLTFSVWRKEKYEQLKQNSKPKELSYLTMKFHQEIDHKLLYEFIAKVKEGIKDSFKALRSPSSNKLKQFQEENQYQSLIVEYIEAATSQLYRLEILNDLLTIPYGIPVVDSYYLKKQFTSKQQTNNNGIISKLIDNHSKMVVSKGLSALGTQVWSRVAMLMIGGMNVLGFAGGVAITQAVDFVYSRMGKNKRKLKLQSQIISFNSNSLKLQNCIRITTQLLDKYLQSDQKEVRQLLQKQFRQQIGKVFEFDQQELITIVQLDNGWKVVDYKKQEEDDEFQVLEEEEKEKKE